MSNVLIAVASLDLKVPVLAGKRGSRRHSAKGFSESVILAKQVIKFWKFYYFALRRGLNLLRAN